jgi:ubiquinone/menaquinone biosynthesis C-methylase UbiE
MSSNDVNYVNAIQSNEGWLRILASFGRFLEPDSNMSLLDIGCGPGAFLDIVRRDFGTKTTGIDINPAMLVQSKQLFPGCRFLAADARNLPFSSATFDYVTAANVLYLLDNYDQVLSEVRRVLKIGGTFAMLNPSPRMSIAAATTVADKQGLWGRVAEQRVRWSVEDIRAMLEVHQLHLGDSRERVGPGLALYIKAEKRS